MKNNIEYKGINNYSKLNKSFYNANIINIGVFLIIVVCIFTNLKKTNTAQKNNTCITSNEIYKDLNLEEEKILFINKVMEGAEETYNKYKILPSITIGQAILESAWGQSYLASNYNNLFGIKADSRWDGAVATIVTNENYNDVVEACFRQYENIEESIEDHGKFLYENDRYTNNGLFKGKDYIEQAQALEDAGYSTAKNENGEPIYADKLIGIIEQYNLMVYDKS